MVSRGYALDAMHRLLILVASLIVEHRLWGMWALVLAAVKLSSVGSVVMVHGLTCPAACGNLPGPGIKPVSPALAGRFLTSGAPGSPHFTFVSDLKLHCSSAISNTFCV